MNFQTFTSTLKILSLTFFIQARIFRLRVTLLDGLLHNPKAAVVGQEHQFQMSIELRLLRRVSTRFSPARILGSCDACNAWGV